MGDPLALSGCLLGCCWQKKLEKSSGITEDTPWDTIRVSSPHCRGLRAVAAAPSAGAARVFQKQGHSFGPGGIIGVKEQERGWEMAGTSACSVQSHRGLGGVSERVQSHSPCNAALLPGWEVNRGHLEGEEPGTARGVKGSSGGSG